jgi:diguanylate cyclase (GGDEF)-like protein
VAPYRSDPDQPIKGNVDAGTIKDAAAASAATYESFADATRGVLDVLERHVPAAAVFLAHLDRAQSTFRVVDVRGGSTFGLRPNLALPLEETFCAHMADDHAPRRCDDVEAHALYGTLPAQRVFGARAYLGVPLQLSNGARVGSLAAFSAQPGRFTDADEQLLAMLAKVLAHELERESNARDVRKLNASLREQALQMGALETIAHALGGNADPRPVACRVAAQVVGAQVCALLEPSGRDFVSSAVFGAELAPVTIQPRPEVDTGFGRAFTATEPYTVVDARSHPALARPLVDATGARSARFEPVVRNGEVVGVLLLIWSSPREQLADDQAGVLRLVAAQAGAAIHQAALRARAGQLALSDPLTGVAARRLWDEELPRELARARRYDLPLSVAVIDVDHLGSFNRERGRREGDRLLKEAAASWRMQLRDVDLVSRLSGGTFGIVLPSCGLAEACDVLERLRETTPRAQTASAGVARWDGEEPAELLVLRCREALATAKSAGRDMIISAD